MHKFKDSKFWKNYNKFDKVVGQSSMRSTVDALFFWKLFNQYNFSNILEFGVYQGLTTGLMIESTGNLVSYTGIDPYLKLDTFYSIWPARDNINFYPISSQSFVSDQTYDFILVDGDHSYSAALADLQHSEKLLAPNGVLAIDDYNLSADMIQAVADFKKTTKLVPFLQVEQTEFWHSPSCDRSDFLDSLFNDPINNFIFMYNINSDSILKAKTTKVFTDELNFFNQVLEFYNV